ncbi:hypothetical protein C6Q08_06720 [Burkholderia multivorans]|nr:hypothetical protein C6Q08_06720 [Burkholderia multivorans]
MRRPRRSPSRRARRAKRAPLSRCARALWVAMLARAIGWPIDRETRAADAVAPILDARNLTMLQ